jgi:hypothetical protein
MVKVISLLLVVGGIFGIASRMNTPPKFEGNIMHDPKLMATEGFAVVELFTSEGCSSCPPADEILSDLATKDKVFPLSFHVTYWNRLGWKDPFSQAEFDERQYGYGGHFKLKSIYTPQVVINGNSELVGSKRLQIEKTMDAALSQSPTYHVDLSKKMDDKTLVINYKIDKKPLDCVLHIALVERNLEVKVPRGENEGRTLKHDNVVRVFKTLKVGSDMEGMTDLLISDDFKVKDCAVIAYLQEEKTRKIVGAARLPL